MHGRRNDDFIDSIIKTLFVVAFFLSSYLLLPNLLHPLREAAIDDPIAALQRVDIRPQKFAYMASLVLTLLATGLAIVGLQVRARGAGFATKRDIDLPPLFLKVNEKVVRFLTALQKMQRPSLTWTIIAIVFCVLAISFFADSYGSRTGSLLFFSDTHAYLDFAGTGEALTRGKLSGPDAINAYGIGAAAIYALLRDAGFSASYSLVYNLAWAFNVAFLFFWGATLIKIASRENIEEWVGFVFLLGILILVPPLITTKQVWTLYPTMSATRYVPFLLLFAFMAWGPERTSFQTQFLGAVLAFIGLCFAPDVGAIALLGYTANVALDRKIDWWTPLRTGGWLVVLFAVCLAGGWLVRSASGYELIGTLKFIFGVANRDITNTGLPWTSVGLLAFAASIFTIISVGPSFFRRNVQAVDRVAFIAAGMILTWGIYFIRRPDKNYWIFDALLFVLLIFFASKVQGIKLSAQKLGVTFLALILLYPLADQGIHRSVNLFKDMVVTQIREYRQPKSHLAGVDGPTQWALASRSHALLLKDLGGKVKEELVAVAGQPYLATLFAGPNTEVHEGGFTLGTTEKVRRFVKHIVENGRPVVAVDGPGSPLVFRDMGQRVAEILSAELLRYGYERLPASVAPGWIVLKPKEVTLSASGASTAEIEASR